MYLCSPRPLEKSKLPWSCVTMALACTPAAPTCNDAWPLPPLPPARQKIQQNAVVTSPVTMWLDAIDVALSRLAALSAPPSPLGDKEPACPGKETQTEQEGGPEPVTTWGRSVLARVTAVSVSGQQHGTVFWKAGAEERLKGLGGLGPKDTLVEVRALPPVLKPPTNVDDSSSRSWCVPPPPSRLSRRQVVFRRYSCHRCFGFVKAGCGLEAGELGPRTVFFAVGVDTTPLGTSPVGTHGNKNFSSCSTTSMLSNYPPPQTKKHRPSPDASPGGTVPYGPTAARRGSATTLRRRWEARRQWPRRRGPRRTVASVATRCTFCGRTPWTHREPRRLFSSLACAAKPPCLSLAHYKTDATLLSGSGFPSRRPSLKDSQTERQAEQTPHSCVFEKVYSRDDGFFLLLFQENSFDYSLFAQRCPLDCQQVLPTKGFYVCLYFHVDAFNNVSKVLETPPH